MKLTHLLMIVPALALGAACSSSQDAGVTGTGTGTGPDTGPANNPYGVAYPTQHIGYKARRGTAAGDVIANYRFRGYKQIDPTQPVTTGTLGQVQMADFFDPQMKQFKVIHLVVASYWCPPCNQETDDTVALTADLLKEGIVIVQALNDGPTQGVGATQADLDKWIGKHKSNFTEMLDPGQQNLGQFFDAAAVPWNANIDARTMEILESGTGYSGDVKAETEKWTQWVDSHPPTYQ